MPQCVNFLFSGEVALSSALAATVIAESDQLDVVAGSLLAVHQRLTPDTDLLENPAVSRFYKTVEAWKTAFYKRDSLGFHHYRKKVADAVFRIPDERWQVLTTRINPTNAGLIRFSDTKTVADLLRAASGASLVNVDVINFENRGAQGILLGFDCKMDLISNVTAVVREIVEQMKANLQSHFRLVITGDSVSASDVATMALVFLGELTRQFSQSHTRLSVLQYIEVELRARGEKGTRIYANEWGVAADGLIRWVPVSLTRSDWTEITPPPAGVEEVVGIPVLEVIESKPHAVVAEAGHAVNIWEMPNSGGRRAVCDLEGSDFTEGLTLQLLTKTVQGVLARFPNAEEITVNIPQEGLVLKEPLAETWAIARQLPGDIFPSRREVGVMLRFNGETEARYGFFRGDRGLRKVFYDGADRWEILEIQPEDGEPYELLTRTVSRIDSKSGATIAGVEVYADEKVRARAKRKVQQILTDAATILAQRRGLQEMILVVDSDTQVSNVIALANGFAMPILNGNPEFGQEGTVVVVFRQPLRVPPAANVVALPGKRETAIYPLKRSGFSGWSGKTKEWPIPPVLRIFRQTGAVAARR